MADLAIRIAFLSGCTVAPPSQEKRLALSFYRIAAQGNEGPKKVAYELLSIEKNEGRAKADAVVIELEILDNAEPTIIHQVKAELEALRKREVRKSTLEQDITTAVPWLLTTNRFVLKSNGEGRHCEEIAYARCAPTEKATLGEILASERWVVLYQATKPLKDGEDPTANRRYFVQYPGETPFPIFPDPDTPRNDGLSLSPNVINAGDLINILGRSYTTVGTVCFSINPSEKLAPTYIQIIPYP